MELVPLPSPAFTGWSALVNAAAGVASFTALVLFFIVGGPWGPVNDVLSVMWALSLVPLAAWFLHANGPANPWLSGLSAALGIGSMLVFAVLQALLAAGQVRYEETVGAVMTLIGLIGVWLLVNALLARGHGVLPDGLTWAMLAFGLGLVISAAGFRLGGEQSPLAAGGYVLGAVAGAVWAGWLARWLLAGRLVIESLRGG